MEVDLRESLKTSYEMIYGEEKTRELFFKLEELLHKYPKEDITGKWLTEKDSMLITYGDTLTDQNRPGIEVLQEFLKEHVKDAISSVHLLPMFPYTSDDGFSVVDYKEIDKPLGDWNTIHSLAEHYKLMFDGVVNHISKSSEWFQKFLACEEKYKDYFITANPKDDYSSVTRPRALPLLTEFDTKEGKKYIWTTFSEDQIDLNFRSIDIYIEILDVLLFYAKNGAKYIRLDAIGFLWKELGTSCMHLPKTHEVIRTYRQILDVYAPGTILITETNVPHKDNISYLGGEKEEAHLVYQFPLPPLVMFSFLKEDCSKLFSWASSLEPPKKGTTFFNFLSSHDGIGVRPTEGILTKEEQQFLVDATLRNGGEVSYKDNGDGTKSPYELNVNYQDALTSPEESDQVRIQKFIAAETLLLSLQGLPGIYIHSLLGSRNDYYGKTTSQIPRRINREKLDVSHIMEQLNGESNRSSIFHELIRRLRIRKEHSAFSPEAGQNVVKITNEVMAIHRESETEKITVYVNFSSKRQILKNQAYKGVDILTGNQTEGTLVLDGFQCIWLLGELR